MKIALLDIKTGTKLNSVFTAVNMKNFEILARELNADFLYSRQDARLSNNTYDAIICGFSSNNTDLDATLEFVRRNAKAALFFLVGEYEQDCFYPAYYLKRNYVCIRNYEGKSRIQKSCQRYQIADIFININLLKARQPNEMCSKKYDCIYYGRWRNDRTKYYTKYIHDIFLSTSRKNAKQYKHIGCTPTAYLDPVGWKEGRETLNLFRYSLYIEDEYTHTHYNCLANRWYEAGFCNNVVLFDADCENTIRRSEIGHCWEQIQPYIVHNSKELQDKISEFNHDFEKHLAIQKSWRLGEPLLKKQMIESLRHIINTKQWTNEIH